MDTRFESRNRDARFLAYSSNGVTTDVKLEKNGPLIVLRILQEAYRYEYHQQYVLI